STQQLSQTEMQKSFEKIHLEPIYGKYKQLINNYSDFPEQVKKAKELHAQLQEDYMKKKIAHLENKTETTTESLKAKNAKLSEELSSREQRLSELEQQLEQ